MSCFVVLQKAYLGERAFASCLGSQPHTSHSALEIHQTAASAKMARDSLVRLHLEAWRQLNTSVYV